MNRDFKGVWIPREIWLSTNLSIIEKILITEISSLDNENNCTAGNDYFAEFCNCSTSAITKALKHLKELGLIEEVGFNGRIRKLRVVNFTTLPSKIYEADSENLRAINIYNNINNKKESISKDIDSTENCGKKSDFNFGKKAEPKPSLYSKCVAMIDAFIVDNKCANDREALIAYLKFRLEVKDKPLYINMWKGMLKKLEELHDKGYTYSEIIQFNLLKGYLSFYEPSKSKKYERASEPKHGTGCKKNTAEEDKQREVFLKQMKKEGKRVTF